MSGSAPVNAIAEYTPSEHLLLTLREDGLEASYVSWCFMSLLVGCKAMAGHSLVSQSPGGAEHQPHLISCSACRGFCISWACSRHLMPWFVNSNLKACFGTGWAQSPSPFPFPLHSWWWASLYKEDSDVTLKSCEPESREQQAYELGVK